MRYYCDVVNSHLGGFKDADDYYRTVSSVHYLARVRTPLLAINSRDDPVTFILNLSSRKEPNEPLPQIACERNLPFREIEKSPWVVLATTGGGHVGWFETGARRWYVQPVKQYLSAFLDVS